MDFRGLTVFTVLPGEKRHSHEFVPVAGRSPFHGLSTEETQKVGARRLDCAGPGDDPVTSMTIGGAKLFTQCRTPVGTLVIT
jgi:hypothetical protein